MTRRGRRWLVAGTAGVVAAAGLARGLPALGTQDRAPAPAVRVVSAAAPHGAVRARADAVTPVWQQVRMGPQRRSFLLAVPPGPGPHPLLVVLHGLDQHAQTFLATTGLVQRAVQAGVAVAGPETPDASWNDGRFGPAGRDDDAYVMAVVDQLQQEGVAERDRTALAGFSNGAGMSVELAAAHPGRFSALVLVGGVLLDAPRAPRPSVPVRTVLVHGTDDPVQPWAGHPRRSGRLPAQLGVPDTVAAFVRAAGGGPAGPASALPHEPGAVPVTVQTWRGADAGVTLDRLLGAGHVWPLASCPPGSCRPHGDVARRADVSATELAVRAALAPAVPAVPAVHAAATRSAGPA